MKNERLMAEYVKGAFMYASAAMRSLVLLSGGASALLFVSAMSRFAPAFALAAWLFFFAALLGSGALGFSYLSQAFFIQLEDERCGTAFQGMAVVTAVTAFGAALWASVLAYRAFMRM